MLRRYFSLYGTERSFLREFSMKISVVIPAFNAASCITNAFDSVREQSITPFEVLITNDGSTDRTESVIKQYAEKNPQFPIDLAGQPNKGIGAARNNGLFRAKGDFVAFLDADDRWYPEKLEAVVGALSRNPDKDVIYHNEIHIDINGKEKAKSYGKILGTAYDSLLFSNIRLSTSATVVRRSLSVKIGGFSQRMDFNSAEDYDFWLRLAKNGATFYYLDKILGEYRRSPTSISTRIEYHLNNSYNVFCHHIKMMYREGQISKSKYERKVRARTGKRDTAIARSYYLCGQPGKAVQLYIRCIKQWPFYWKTYAGLILALRSHFL